MSDVITKASDLADYITARVALIKTADGYNTDIGLSVHRGRLKIDDDMIPCAVIIEGDDQPGDVVNREEIKITQSYVLGGYVKCDPDQPNDAAHLVIKDLKKAIFTGLVVNGGVNFDRKVRSVRYVGRNIGPRSDGKAFVFAVIYIDVEFSETLANA